MKRQAERKVTRRVANVVQGVRVSDPEYINPPSPPTSPYTGVWNGQIARLRYYISQQMLYVYLAPGYNDNYIGVTTDPTMMKTLFLARDNGRIVSGYTADDQLVFIDY